MNVVIGVVGNNEGSIEEVIVDVHLLSGGRGTLLTVMRVHLIVKCTGELLILEISKLKKSEGYG
jgi:hypothetical protein